ncbi:MAG TPA: trehalase family glycosidase [Terracidiphilus sp.]|jgi:putative isomerase|nr:trehalase family glycosidase [Terracidiphilus sp.]
MMEFSRRAVLRAMRGTIGTLALCKITGAERQRQHSLSSDMHKNAAETLIDYFSRIAPDLLRPENGYLKHPSLSPSLPGNAYSTDLWDWDTLWTARGLFRLAELKLDSALKAKLCTHAVGSLENFLDHQSPEGRIPILISAQHEDLFNSLSTEKPNPHNQAKPVMAQIALLVADKSHEVDWLACRFDQILRFHNSWRDGNGTPLGLMVWGNDVAIGMDNDPTTFGRPPFSSANIMLNCLFYQELRACAELALRLKRTSDHDRIQLQAEALGAAIQKYCWDRRDAFYYTADVMCVDQRSKWLPGIGQGMAMSWRSLPMRIQTVAGFLPLWCGLASAQQANELVERNYRRDDRFRAAFGVRTLSSFEPMYSLTAHSGNPSNWLGPIWIITNYLTWKALKNYGFEAEAAELADKTVTLLANDLETSGTLNEYYQPDTGEPISHRGFVDWNMLVLEMISTHSGK